MLANIPAHDLDDLCARLVFGKGTVRARIIETARLVQNLDGLTDPACRPSQIVARLEGIDDLALLRRMA